MKNRKLLLIVSLVLALTMSLGGTLAYLTDTDADVNTMVLGNVEIVQNEQERNANGELVEFTQDKPLLPAVYEDTGIRWERDDEKWPVAGDEAWKTLVDNVNVLDKFVTVTNKGNTDAYVRTLIAFEGDLKEGTKPVYLNHTYYVDDKITPLDWYYNVKINDKVYTVVDFTYKDALGAKETSTPSLKQIYLRKEASNEDLKDLDTNGNGTYDILVISQAVQANGFTDVNGNGSAADDALNAGFNNGETLTAEVIAAWFEELYSADGTVNQGMIGSPDGDKNDTNNPPVFVAANGSELAELLAAGADIALVKNVDYGTAVIDGELNGVTIQGAEGAKVRFNIMSTAKLNNVTFADVNTTFSDSSSAFVDGGVFNIDKGAIVKNLVIENCDVTGSGGRSSLVGISEPSAEVTIKNTKLNGTKYMVYASAPVAKLTVEGCTVENVSSWVVMMNAADAVGAVLTIDGNAFNNCSDGIAKYLGSSQPEGAATVFTNNTLTNCAGHDGKDAAWFTIPGAIATITVSGNTLDGVEFNPGTAQGLGK